MVAASLEDVDGERAPKPADAVHGDGVERVVDLELPEEEQQ